MSLTLDSSAAATAAALVAAVLGTSAPSMKTGASALAYENASGFAVLSTLAQKCGRADLIGTSDAEQKQVAEWVSIVASASADRAFLERLNTHLLASAFLAPLSYQPTVADYAAYAVIKSTFATVSSADATAQLPNLSRWARCVVASVPRGSIPSEVKSLVSLETYDLPAALASRIAEMDLVAAAQSDASKRLPPLPNPATIKPAADAATAAKPTVPYVGKPKPVSKQSGVTFAPTSTTSTAAAPVATQASAAAAPAAASDVKKEKKAKAAAPAAAAASGEVPRVYRVNFKVGKIVAVENHPTEARLYVTKVEVGEAAPRTVVCGMREWIKVEDLLNKLVVVILNLKAGDIKGVPSNGRMMVATSQDEKTKEMVAPPAGAQIGESITFANVPADKAPDAELAAKQFHEILKGLKTSEEKHAQYNGVDFMTSAGPCTVPTVANGTVA